MFGFRKRRRYNGTIDVKINNEYKIETRENPLFPPALQYLSMIDQGWETRATEDECALFIAISCYCAWIKAGHKEEALSLLERIERNGQFGINRGMISQNTWDRLYSNINETNIACGIKKEKKVETPSHPPKLTKRYDVKELARQVVDERERTEGVRQRRREYYSHDTPLKREQAQRQKKAQTPSPRETGKTCEEPESTIKYYVNPFSQERICTETDNDESLQLWREKYGSERVKTWVVQVERKAPPASSPHEEIQANKNSYEKKKPSPVIKRHVEASPESQRQEIAKLPRFEGTRKVADQLIRSLSTEELLDLRRELQRRTLERQKQKP